MKITHPASVRYGSLVVPLAAQRQVDAALAYLARDPVERRLIERVERSPVRHRIEIVHHHDDAYRPWSHAIRWDPHSAMRTTGGGRQSPALGLAHELDHAAAHARDLVRLQTRGDPAYDDAEERRVITGTERHAARTLHESERRDHRGACYRVADPTQV